LLIGSLLERYVYSIALSLLVMSSCSYCAYDKVIIFISVNGNEIVEKNERKAQKGREYFI